MGRRGHLGSSEMFWCLPPSLKACLHLFPTVFRKEVAARFFKAFQECLSWSWMAYPPVSFWCWMVCLAFAFCILANLFADETNKLLMSITDLRECFQHPTDFSHAVFNIPTDPRHFYEHQFALEGRAARRNYSRTHTISL